MEEARRDEIALFRFSVIGSLVSGEVAFGELNHRMKELSKRIWNIPYSTRRCIGWGTIEEWLYLYRKNGFDGLKPKQRNDRGRSRSIPLDVLKLVARTKQDNLRRPVSLICSDLYKQGKLKSPYLPLSTLYRFLGTLNLKQKAVKKQQKRYEHRYSNDMWQTDVMHGPAIPHKEGDKPQKTYLFAIIDDASRLIVGADFYSSEKLIHLKTALRQAICQYNIPRKLFVDNGRIYKAYELEVACAKLNTHLIYGTPYHAQGRGKIERFHKTLRDRFLTGLRDVRSLLELNQALHAWVADEYNRRPHIGIDNETPLDKYLRLCTNIRRLPPQLSLEELFYHQEKRQVAKDSTFRINNILYEAPEHLIGMKIDVLYDSDDMERVIIQYHGKSEGICKPIDYLANAKIKRKSINFNQILNKEREDDNDACCILT